MPGGPAESYTTLGPILESISAKVDGEPCCVHIGPDGAGHFVKMVHNGIEYADMQFIAEAFDVLHSAGLTPKEISEVLTQWNTGDLDSYLIEITAEVLAHVDAETGAPFVSVVEDAAEQKGTGRWTVQIALELGVPVNTIAESVFARSTSGHAALRTASRAALTGPERSVPTRTRARRSSRASGRPCGRRRSSPTRRGWTRSAPRPRSSAGTSTSPRSRRSGAAGASSGPSCSSGSVPSTPPAT